MIQDSGSFVFTLAATIAIIIVLFFLPALIEFKKPKDEGPRSIKDDSAKIRISSLNVALIDIEEDQKFTYRSTTKTADILSALLDLEV